MLSCSAETCLKFINLIKVIRLLNAVDYISEFSTDDGSKETPKQEMSQIDF